jgi:hypothetical protein
MDQVTKVLFGKMPISQLTSVQAAVNQKNNNQTIFIMGAIILVGGIYAYYIYRENQELKLAKASEKR